ncbi:MAG UNVERIFIED_CONTAM: hypothetical protein LVR18_22660 [Planctomycetaceae bacterium]
MEVFRSEIDGIFTQSLKHDGRPAPGVYTKRELARLLQISERQIEHLRKRQGIRQPFHIGRSVPWCRGVIDRWLSEGAHRQRGSGGGCGLMSLTTTEKRQEALGSLSLEGAGNRRK